MEDELADSILSPPSQIPGIPLIYYGEEQGMYLFDNTAANYVRTFSRRGTEEERSAGQLELTRFLLSFSAFSSSDDKL